MFLGATLWQYQMPGKTFFGLWNVPSAVYEINEGWDGDAGNEERVASMASDAGEKR